MRSHDSSRVRFLLFDRCDPCDAKANSVGLGTLSLRAPCGQEFLRVLVMEVVKSHSVLQS